MIETFVWGIICLFTYYKKHYPNPCSNRKMNQNVWKCVLSGPVIHDPSNLPYVSTCYIIYACSLLAAHPPPYHGCQTTGKPKQIVTDEQCIHKPANMIIYCLRNNYTLLYTLNTETQKKHPIIPNQTVITYSLKWYYKLKLTTRISNKFCVNWN